MFLHVPHIATRARCFLACDALVVSVTVGTCEQGTFVMPCIAFLDLLCLVLLFSGFVFVFHFR